ncbi:MAG: hypothetical protein JOZ24_05325 [Candidatus Eremiobacteraeota bacterium]|nr:hypothetical protein [Candidatus Eremiobacteraeota bacterium]
MQHTVRRSLVAVSAEAHAPRRLNPVELFMLALGGTLVLDLSVLGWGLTHGWPN